MNFYLDFLCTVGAGALPPGKPKKEVKVPVQKELPADAIKVHPVMLLNQMRPGLTYVELCRSGNPPNTMFTIAVVIDGKEYSGTGKYLFFIKLKIFFKDN